ncbi:MAG TPA: hypothetical protein VGK74_22825 [Symbiobacteriaceae bacterium]|jgi:hypothetical protein
MASPVIHALEHAMYTGSSEKLYYWAFRHPNPDAPPETYRLTRRAGNGWALLLAASKATKEVLAFYAETPEDAKAVQDALRWLEIGGQVESGPEGAVLNLAGGQSIASRQAGGEKKTK